MLKPLVSVVLTTYNRSHLLPRAINSVLTGTYDQFELLVMDDASSDDTPEVVAKFTDERIKYVRIPENGGVLKARNRGFDTAQGDYIAILDDDDELTKDALSMIVSEFERTENQAVNILWFNCTDAESNQPSGSMTEAYSDISFEDYICGRIWGDFWIVFRRPALEGNRFNEQLKANESLLWLRMHRQHKARFIPKVLCYKYRDHGGDRLSNANVKLQQLGETTLAMTLFIDEFGSDLIRLCPELYGKRLAYLGFHQLTVGDFSGGRQSIFNSLKYDFSIKYLGLYCLSFLLSKKQIVHLMKWNTS